MNQKMGRMIRHLPIIKKLSGRRRVEKARADSIKYHKWINGEIDLGRGTATMSKVEPSDELEYFEQHRDDYLDDREDIISYRDEIFDFYED